MSTESVPAAAGDGASREAGALATREAGAAPERGTVAAVEAARDEAIARVTESAARMGIELDEADAAAWVAAMATESAGGDLVVDAESGVYGHRISMLDFEAHDLARFRAMARIVGFEDRPGVVATALALSGSAAQGKIHDFPADCDFFERIHVRAATREEACTVLGEVIRDKALTTLSGPGYQLYEVTFGSHPATGAHRGRPVRPRAPISWHPEELQTGEIEVLLADGSRRTITWAEASREPGWCKLDWVIADAARGRLANASNMLDPTWERPDGGIEPLDGFLDPYYQEVYLEADSIPLFSRLVKQLSGDAVDEYVDQLEREVVKYAGEEPNFGKVARRLYNIFRLRGRYPEAAYVRELFDEPVSALYQVAALVRTLDDAASAQGHFDPETMVAQLDKLIMSAIGALEGPVESEIVAHLLSLRDSLRDREEAVERAADVAGVRAAAITAVNTFFRARLEALPGVREYLEGLGVRATPAS